MTMARAGAGCCRNRLRTGLLLPRFKNSQLTSSGWECLETTRGCTIINRPSLDTRTDSALNESISSLDVTLGGTLHEDHF